MKTTPRNRTIEELKDVQAAAGNGLFDRRAFLRGGAAFAAAITSYSMTKSASAEPLADDPWSKVPALGARPMKSVRATRKKSSALSATPKVSRARSRAHTAPFAQRHVHAQRVSFHDHSRRHAGHRPGEASPGDPRPGEATVGLHARCLGTLPDGLAHDVRRVRWQQRAVFCQGTHSSQRAGTARFGVLRRVDRRQAFDVVEETGIDPKAKWFVAEGADAPALSRSVPGQEGVGRHHDRALSKR